MCDLVALAHYCKLISFLYLIYIMSNAMHSIGQTIVSVFTAASPEMKAINRTKPISFNQLLT